MAVAIERYITVCHPFFKLSHNWSPKKYIIPILIFSVAYNIPKFGELEVIPFAGRSTFYPTQIIFDPTRP